MEIIEVRFCHRLFVVTREVGGEMESDNGWASNVIGE